MAKKHKYKVHVCRTGYGFLTIEVEAENEEQAEELALDEAGSHEFSEKDADYTTDGVYQIDEDEKDN